jgi:hypothetical protein
MRVEVIVRVQQVIILRQLFINFLFEVITICLYYIILLLGIVPGVLA